MGKQHAAGASHVEGIDFDIPLLPESAIDSDQLSRVGFAEIATASLRKVPSTSGFRAVNRRPMGKRKKLSSRDDSGPAQP